LFLKLPLLFLNFGMKRQTAWADAAEPAERKASPVPVLG